MTECWTKTPPFFFYKQEAHGPHCSPEQQFPGFLVFYFIANAISISIISTTFRGYSIGPMVGFNNSESTLFENICVVISQIEAM